MFRPLLAAAVLAAALVAVPALAQVKDPYYEPAYDDEIIVIAPGVRRERAGRTASGIPVEELSTSLIVHTNDLDLRYGADVDELHRRIRVTAREACTELERASRGVMLDDRHDCVRDAVRDAMVQADVLVYARG